LRAKKIKRNELADINPFNYCWIGSCFDHGVCAAMPYFGVEHSQFLLAKFEFFKKDLEFEPITDSGNEELYNKLGLRVENAYFKTPDEVMELIDRGIPVLAGIDCFWIKHRIDMYQRTHANHFILIYGYNRRKKHFKTIDHGYINSAYFHEMELSFEIFIKGNKDFIKYYGFEESSGKIILRNDSCVEKGYFVKLLSEKKENWIESKAAVKSNLLIIIEAFGKEFADFVQTSKKFDSFLCKAVLNRNILLYAVNTVGIRGLEVFLDKLIVDYTFVRSLFCRIFYKSDEVIFLSKKENAIERLKNILTAEEKLHDLFLGK
jgi:hypothetical protein